MNDTNALIFKLTTNYLLYIAISFHFKSYNRTYMQWIWLELWCVTSLSTIFQLYRGSQY
jgi:hypothetical protein